VSIPDNTVFFHVPKTGGQSLAEIFSAFFPVEETRINLNTLDRKTLKGKKFISGHGLWSQIGELVEPKEHCFIFTFLRNPYDRQKSAILHGNRDHEVRPHTGIENNCYLKRFSKLVPFSLYSPEAHFHSAIESLSRDFNFVGIFEDFNESTIKLAEMLGVPKKYLNIMAINQHSADQSHESIELDYQKYISNNKYDFMLYDYFRKKTSFIDKTIVTGHPISIQRHVDWCPADPLFGSNFWQRESFRYPSFPRLKNEHGHCVNQWRWAGPRDSSKIYFNLAPGYYRLSLVIINILPQNRIDDVKLSANGKTLNTNVRAVNNYFVLESNRFYTERITCIEIRVKRTAPMNFRDSSYPDQRETSIAISNIQIK